MEREMLALEEVAQILGVHRNTVRRAVNRGELPAVRFGRRILIRRATLERILENGTQPVDGDAPEEGTQPAKIVAAGNA